jgi:hypothetical protein
MHYCIDASRNEHRGLGAAASRFFGGYNLAGDIGTNYIPGKKAPMHRGSYPINSAKLSYSTLYP